MFDLFPHIIVILALAAVVFIVARKFPKVSEKNISKALKEVESKKEASKKIEKITGSDEGDSSSDKDKKKSIFDTATKEKEVREQEKKQALQTKIQMHQNVMKVIDRITELFKKTYFFIKTKIGAVIIFFKAKKAEFVRKRKTDQELVKEKTVALLQKAAREFGAGNHKDAEKNYIEIIKLDPKNILAYKGLGDVYEKQKNFKDAIASYQEVLRRDPLDNEASRRLLELRRAERERKSS